MDDLVGTRDFATRNDDVPTPREFARERVPSFVPHHYGVTHGGVLKKLHVFFDMENELNAAWFLLRLSVHDPVMPLNAESDVPGGVKFVLCKLYEAIGQCEGIDLSPLMAALEA